MEPIRKCLNRLAASLLAIAVFAGGAVAQGADPDDLDRLFRELAKPEQPGWQTIEDDIWIRWSASGSASADLLLKRGRDAMEIGDTHTAIEHFTALTDHAPEFAEGWNARATAYFAAGLYGPSIEDIQRALALNPRHFGALSGLGIIYEEIGLKDEALAAYHAVLEIHPHRTNVIEAVERLEAELLGKSL